MKAIEVKELCYTYPSGSEALRRISFTVTAGERVAFVGPNGAGKSTLLMHLNGLLPEKETRTPNIWVFDIPIVGASMGKVRSKVGLLFQDPDDQLFCSTVWEDVAFGPRQLGLNEREVENRVKKSLRQVGLEGMEKQRNPYQLSRGEKRRACIAGLLACECEILVLDEPTTDLDPRGRRELKALLRTLSLTQLIATHDLELVVELCSRVLVIDGGEIVADGIPRVILGNEELMFSHGLECPQALKQTEKVG